MQLLTEFFYYEEEMQVIWLAKLDIVGALRECQPACKSLPSYAVLLSNMMLLDKSELRGVTVDIVHKLC